MAKKKTTSTKIWVKKPVIGNTYYFKFAGGIMKGVLDEPSDRLSSHYNTKWFWMKSVLEGRTMRYPVAIHDIAEVYDNLKPNN